MSTVEVKHALRKIEFPECAREAIKKIETLVNGRAPSIKQMDLAIDLMGEFVFWEKDRRGNKRSNELTAVQEMQLLQVLCEYFSAETISEITKNTLFLNLFGPSTIQLRLKVLCKLVSLGISTSCAPLLIATGTWMQQLGCTSTASLQLARAVVKDYFALIPSVLPTLRTLPDIAPQFAANLLTAIADIYLTNVFTPPPESLLQTVTDWVTNNPMLCFAAQQKSAALPYGGIVMPTVTPVAGLLKWCILAPLYYSNNPKRTAILATYTQLHLALLQSLLEVKNSGVPLTTNIVCSQHLAAIIQPIRTQIADTGKDIERDDCVQLCLDRLAQAVQVSISTKSLYGNVEELLLQMEQLPSNRLLTIVLTTHKSLLIL